jgi:hypothetical protein
MYVVYHSGDNVVVDLRQIRRRIVWCGLDVSGSGEGSVGVCCERGNEYSGFMKA